MARYRSGEIRIDCSEFLGEVDDDDLLDEVRSRKLSTSEGESTDMDIVKEAFEALRCGRSGEALSILDRLVNPKWKSRQLCETQYKNLFQS